MRFFKNFDHYLSSTHHKYGWWYTMPRSLSMEDWEAWRNYVQSRHPIQYFIRDTISGLSCSLKHKKAEIKAFISALSSPAHPIIRKALPRRWTDITELVIDLNLAIIDQFKEEADGSFVDWSHDEKIVAFKKWLDAAAHYVRVERPQLLKEESEAYPPYPLPPDMVGKTYEEIYGKQMSIRKKIDETDVKLIKEMVDNREFMWT